MCVCGGGAPGCFNGSTESEEMRTNKQITEKMSSLPTVTKKFRLSLQKDEQIHFTEKFNENKRFFWSDHIVTQSIM